jgi:hypothetical protein
MDDHSVDLFYDEDVKRLAARVFELLGDAAFARAMAATLPELRAFALAPTVETLMRFRSRGTSAWSVINCACDRATDVASASQARARNRARRATRCRRRVRL